MCKTAGLTTLLLLTALVAANAQTYKFQSIGFLAPSAINAEGTIVGSFCCSYSPGFDGAQANFHAFLLRQKGPGNEVFKVAEPDVSQESFATGINADGNVVGGFCPRPSSCAVDNAMHGYLFLVSFNSVSRIDVPGAIATLAGGINKAGEIVGMACKTVTCNLAYASDAQGFLLDHIGGNFSTINFPGVLGTAATAINDSGEIVGNYLACKTDGSRGAPCTFAQGHGFQLVSGVYTTLDPPGSLATTVGGVNNSGVIVGTYLDGSNKTHGFLFSNGVFSNIDFPGASATEVNGINDQGQIVGSAQIGEGTEGFIGTPN